MLPSTDASGSCTSSNEDDVCGPPPTTLATLLSVSPFLATFVLVSLVVATHVFPRLARIQSDATGVVRNGDDYALPASAPPSLRQAHAAHGARSARRRVAALTFAATLGLATVLAELILAEISDFVGPRARDLALRVTVPALLVLVIVVIPVLELMSVVAGSGWTFQRSAKGRAPRVAWGLLAVGFAGWLCVFWSLGRAVPMADERDYLYAFGGGEQGEQGEAFDATGMTIGRAAIRKESVGEMLERGGLSRACLERVGVIGISLMALLSGFASVSSPWHTFADNRSYRRRPITDADIARKQAGLEATSELLLAKRHRLRALQRKLAEAAPGGISGVASSSGLVGKMLGSLKGIASGSGGDAAEIKGLQLEISGLETMESNLSSSLSLLRTRQAAHARDGTALGRLLAIPGYIFSFYCVYRILATTLTTAHRMYYPSATFSSSDPINRFLGLLARHWDPKLDQMAWARQISFLLSGVILAASANSVMQTFHLFARWMPGLLYQAQANLALLIGQIAATYVISAALLLRSNLPREVGRSVGDALESALEPGFVDRWFEGWFLFASVATAVGIWVGRKLAGGGGSGVLGGEYYLDEWDEFAGEEMGAQKRS
ncbi:Abscisic acid G-protein coupled receptor-domain-containing protein [Lasiosphaeria hispida]|uniref:Abscisic acid G-protein coupled receptor-domain-containing protein n=1 Tax=Lasiosphaeria hispida TaxID=260671 RepID=A0AAJ0MFR7_9PEZI|nr:Abscisic acid G-protein coupled receptor-domain-containing protein [Lasiosphaeria hispida]